MVQCKESLEVSWLQVSTEKNKQKSEEGTQAKTFAMKRRTAQRFYTRVIIVFAYYFFFSCHSRRMSIHATWKSRKLSSNWTIILTFLQRWKRSGRLIFLSQIFLQFFLIIWFFVRVYIHGKNVFLKNYRIVRKLRIWEKFARFYRTLQ